MKNRKIAIVAFMLCAALLLGVGYAALSTTLTIDGTAYLKSDVAQDEFEGDITFQSVAATANTNKVTPASGVHNTAEIDDASNLTATFVINTLAIDGDTATFTAVIQNTGEFDANLSVAAVKMDGVAVALAGGAYACDDISATISFSNPTLAAGTDLAPSTVTVTLVFELLNTPTQNENHTFTIDFNATSVD